MNKQDLSIVIFLSVLLFAWMWFSKTQRSPQDQKGIQETEEVSGEHMTVHTNAGAKAISDKGLLPVEDAGDKDAPLAQDLKTSVPEPSHLPPEKRIALDNDVMKVTVSSRGGGIVLSELKNYRAAVDKESDPVCLDFAGQPALSLTGFTEFSTNNDFGIELNDSGDSVLVTKTVESGLKFDRTITISEGYVLKIKDVFLNESSMPITLPGYGISIGPMQMVQTKATTRGISYLGLDTLASAGGEDVVHWSKGGPTKENSKSLSQRFDPDYRRGVGCFKPRLREPLRKSISVSITDETDWIAAKNKFFMQILTPEGSGKGYLLNARRLISEKEDPENPRTWAGSPTLQEVSASMSFQESLLKPGASLSREVSYYVGPKKYDILKQLGNNQDKIMFRAWRYCGWFRSLCIGLLWTLNSISGVIPNYGVAIILLTVIVRLIFWPITHKSTENMKKMQEVQPLVAELRTKYKDDPRKMNQEVMAIYKERKVNPMMGCLPMVVQIPVFIALFSVLRSAVELRFANFLWIKDLSEPERLIEFGSKIPLLGWDALNILPIIMSVTMFLQFKFTPSSGDPQQQKMMKIMMPVMMLAMLYNVGSGLMLYWSVSQGLHIAQLVMQRGKKAKVEIAAG
ncbi:membrane protein insertase YidC [Verrucomicrobiota bacterium]